MSTISCKKCHQPSDPGMQFCPNCGVAGPGYSYEAEEQRLLERIESQKELFTELSLLSYQHSRGLINKFFNGVSKQYATSAANANDARRELEKELAQLRFKMHK